MYSGVSGYILHYNKGAVHSLVEQRPAWRIVRCVGLSGKEISITGQLLGVNRAGLAYVRGELYSGKWSYYWDMVIDVF